VSFIVIVGIPPEARATIVPFIAKGRTSVLQVKDESIDNLMKRFAGLQKGFAPLPYADEIGWSRAPEGDFAHHLPNMLHRYDLITSDARDRYNDSGKREARRASARSDESQDPGWKDRYARQRLLLPVPPPWLSGRARSTRARVIPGSCAR
jgi:hypothetical protein